MFAVFVPLFDKSGHCSYRTPMELKACRLSAIEDQSIRRKWRNDDIQ